MPTSKNENCTFKFHDASNSSEKYQERFNDFCTRILGLDHLIVLTGLGTSLSFGKDKHAKNIAPSMEDLWKECSEIKEIKTDGAHDSHAIDEVKSIINYQEKNTIEDFFLEINSYLKNNSDSENKTRVSWFNTTHGCKPYVLESWAKLTELADFEKVKTIIRYKDKNNIEDFLSYIDQYLSLSQDLINKAKVEKFKRQAIHKIHETTNFVVAKKDELTDDKWKYHEQFINKLAHRKNKQSRLKLFTTNYDQAFETAASSQGFVVIDGFDFASPARFNPMWYEYDIVHRNTNLNSQDSYLDNVLHLYKLHGSVDWRRDKNGEIVKATINNQEDEKAFIYPSHNKYQSSYNAPYLDMISAFIQALKAPNTALICVGFGFNDDHLNNAIKMALRTNTSLHLLAMASEKSKNNKAIGQLYELVKKTSRVGLFDGYFDKFVTAFPSHGAKNPELIAMDTLKEILESEK
ncbi:MAG: SIR2 family protein [Neisseriaceae bacterium]|nr:SIR2 family protein [Neisseriaceae bacterium]